MNIFMVDKETEMDGELLTDFLNMHQARVFRYKELIALYKGFHQIRNREDYDDNKPNNKLVVNFAKYIVDTLNGYFVGNPIKTVHENKEVADKMKIIAKRNGQNDNNAELAKLCSIYGHAYEFLYQDENANTRVTYIEPMEAFVIYDDTIARNAVFGITVNYDKDNNRSGNIYSAFDIVAYSTNDKGEIVLENESIPHFYGDVPLIEYIENEERQSAFENVETLINGYNKAISEKANDVDYFADAYLAILGVELDEETIKEIRRNRVINLKSGDVDKIIVEFLDKPNADSTQENLINRLEKLIFHISMVANISDENFGTQSGIALKYKLLAMENVALMKERKFVNGMMKRFKMMFTIPNNFTVDDEDYLHIDYIFTRNVPNNVIEEAETSEKLAGVVSKATQLSVLSVVDNVQDELDAIEAEAVEREESLYSKDMNTAFNIDVDADEVDIDETL